MSEEFKYIPYSPYDENIRGLIKEGNIYNLKNAVPPEMRDNIEKYSAGISGIFLPDGTDCSDELFRDIEYMKEMYPEEIRKMSVAVEDECDKLEYEGSPMLVMYPDKEEMRRVARKVFDDLSDSGMISDDYKAESGEVAGGDAPQGPPYVPYGSGCVNCVMRNIIEMLVCNEFCVRRDRHRRLRRRFY